MEQEQVINGITGRLIRSDYQSPKSGKGCYTTQKWRASRQINAHRSISVTIRFDDECGNGYQSFSITGKIRDTKTGDRRDGYIETCGCIHEDIEKHFPKLAHLIKWHLFDWHGPMHYIANTTYHAGNRDHWGLEKGEFRQHTSRGPLQADGVPGVPCWELRLPDRKQVYANEKPAPEWVPVGITGEGKERNLDAARRCAVWPEATDEQLCLPKAELAALLEARLLALIAEFRKDMEACGFAWEVGA